MHSNGYGKVLLQRNSTQTHHREGSTRPTCKRNGSGSSIHILPTHTIDYLESHDDYVKINVPGDVHLKHQTMNYYEKALDPAHFVRIHRSIIVNIQSITRLLQNESGSHQAMLKNGTHLPISKAGYLRLKEVLSL